MLAALSGCNSIANATDNSRNGQAISSSVESTPIAISSFASPNNVTIDNGKKIPFLTDLASLKSQSGWMISQVTNRSNIYQYIDKDGSNFTVDNNNPISVRYPTTLLNWQVWREADTEIYLSRIKALNGQSYPLINISVTDSLYQLWILPRFTHITGVSSKDYVSLVEFNHPDISFINVYGKLRLYTQILMPQDDPAILSIL